MPQVPIPKTWVDGDFFTAPTANTELRDMLNFLINPPRLVLSRVAVLNVAQGTEPVVPWDTEILDTYGMWTPTTPSRITMQVPGKYRVSLIGSWAPNTTASVRVMKIRLNGATPRYTVASIGPTGSPSSDTINNASLTLPYTFAINEFIEIQVSHSVGTAGTILGFSGTNDSYITVEWMGA